MQTRDATGSAILRELRSHPFGLRERTSIVDEMRAQGQSRSILHALLAAVAPVLAKPVFLS